MSDTSLAFQVCGALCGIWLLFDLVTMVYMLVLLRRAPLEDDDAIRDE